MTEQRPQDPPDLHEILRKFELTLHDVEHHVMLPNHIREGKERLEPLSDPPVVRVKTNAASALLYTLNVEKLGRDLHDLLSPCLVGYVLQLRRSGIPVLTQQWRWAKSHTDGLTGWSTDTLLHLASVSKLITAIAMTKLLGERGISCDAKIVSWLPRYWRCGPNVDKLTFRHLMTHRSGLFASLKGDTGPSDFESMKGQIAAGTSDLVSSDYKNVNYALCRILTATVNEDIDPAYLDLPCTSAFAPLVALRDPIWDLLSIRAYARYVNDKIFTPAGVAARAFDHPTDAALAYGAPPDSNPGWNSDDLQTASGAVGWHLSVNELMRVLATFRRSGKIMTGAQAEAMLGNGFGVDLGWPRPSPIGPIFAKGGFWGDAMGRIEQCNAFLLPRRMELVILANSPLCTANTAFMNRVGNAIQDNIELWLFRFFARLTARVGRGP